MLKKLILWSSAMLALVLVAGCARQVVVAEVLQQPLGGKIITASNIWFQDPNHISSVNYQKGRLIPYGTEVEIINASEREINFKDKAGTTYSIKFDRNMMMIPVQTYIAQIFTLKSKEELIKGMRKSSLEKADKGLVAKGMSREEVILSCGVPPAFRTPDLNNSTWFYFLDDNMPYRVIFSGKRVRTILNINE